MKKNKRIGILGGTFDPIHRGHLEVAAIFLEQLSLDEVRFIPCQQTLLKNQAIAKPWQRAAMVALAIVNYPHYRLDTRELKRVEPSYSLLTLQSLHHEFPDSELFWLMGDDVYANVNKWYRWKEMANYCDLVVISRHEDYLQDPEIENHFIMNHRRVIHLTMPKVAAASSAVRAELKNHLDDLPEAVQEYVLENHLYQK